MDFGQWYLRRGRIPRRTWWLHYTLPLALLGFLAGLADSSFGYPVFTAQPADPGSLYAYTGGPISTIVSLATVVPSISSTVSRLHDRGHSAWWLLWALLPFVGVIVLLVHCGFLVGEPQPNRYGPPPAPGQAGTQPWNF